ncbi:hypothetical protein [Streptomyces tsukubensis]|uniref:hypothetical protein n=1 Tax=Streptomyces tsukubensis TaxID=83656 RepID=UPI00344F1B6C
MTLEPVRRQLGDQTVQLNVAYRLLATRDTEPAALEHAADLLQATAAALLDVAGTLRRLADAPVAVAPARPQEAGAPAGNREGPRPRWVPRGNRSGRFAPRRSWAERLQDPVALGEIINNGTTTPFVMVGPLESDGQEPPYRPVYIAGLPVGKARSLDEVTSLMQREGVTHDEITWIGGCDHWTARHEGP